MKKLLLITIASLIYIQASAVNDARMMRFPDINGDLIVFVYAGDIWSVSSNGGEAKRLTSHPGIELFPKISPDGKWIAFSAEYSGNRQIWVMPSEGGSAKQLTFYNSVGVMPPRGGFDNVVLDWTPDSENILFRANRTTFGERNGKYYTISIKSGMEKSLPIVNGGFATYSPDGSQLCFTPVDREFRTWKRYKGGRATELWTYNLDNNTSEQITNWTGSDQWPIWYGDNIFMLLIRVNALIYTATISILEKVLKLHLIQSLMLCGLQEVMGNWYMRMEVICIHLILKMGIQKN